MGYWGTLWQLSVASAKMYFRDFTAIFFTLIFPVIFLVVFGYVNSSDSLRLSTVLENNSQTQIAQGYEEALRQVEVFEFDDDISLDEAKEKLADGDLNAIFVIPEEFGQAVAGPPSGQVTVFVNDGQATFNETVTSINAEILAGFNESIIGPPPEPVLTANVEGVQSADLTTIDYVVPGIIGFSLMSLGIFSIAQGFITYKSSGALRRLFVAPVHPLSFIIAQTTTRLVMVMLNVWTMLLLAYWLFDFQMVGDLFNFTLVSLLGSIMFLGFGFAIAGWAKNENQAAPIANIIFFPMMFLSGTFFPREVFPEWLQPIAEFFPLSYLADALRLVANEAATVLSLGTEMIGMTVWTILIFAIAVKVFRWE